MEHSYLTSRSSRAFRVYPVRGGLDGLIDDVICVPHAKLSRFIEDLENEVFEIRVNHPHLTEEEAKSYAMAEMIKQAYGVRHTTTSC